VYDELARFHTGELLLHLNDYNISVKEVSNRALISATALKGIDTGEAEAIALSVELKPDFLLIDEKEGKMVANEMGIRTIGILGIILLAKQQKLLAAAGPVFDALRSKTKFYFSDSLYNFLLEQAGEN
jgi:predicted nucleic acid-binding protein